MPSNLCPSLWQLSFSLVLGYWVNSSWYLKFQGHDVVTEILVNALPICLMC